MKKTRFTKTEWCLISSTFEDPCYIADVIGVDFETKKRKHQFEDIIDRIEELAQQGQGFINWESQLDLDIIEDAIVSCEFFEGIDDKVIAGEITPQKCAALRRCAKNIFEKTGVRMPITNEIFVSFGEVPDPLPEKCSKCEFSSWHVEPVHIGYSCYDNHNIMTCRITDFRVDIDEYDESKLYKDCPLAKGEGDE